MALYPLLGWFLLRGRAPGWVGYALGAVVGAFVGFGRLYIGVHWPSDVLAGWAIGAAFSLGAIRWLGDPASRRREGSA
jgi:undecaprenyl-diphosphatase